MKRDLILLLLALLGAIGMLCSVLGVGFNL